MAFRMSEQPRTIKIYNLLAGTNEFIGEGDAYIPPHTGLPANSTDIAPPDIPAGFVAVFNSDEASWHLVEDHRGKTVYDVASGDALFISELGPLPENVTWLSPGGEYQKWNGTAWVKDTEAEKLFRKVRFLKFHSRLYVCTYAYVSFFLPPYVVKADLIPSTRYNLYD